MRGTRAMAWAALLAWVPAAACGDDEGGGDASVALDASHRPDAVSIDARPGAPDGPVPDGAPADAGPPDADPALLPDLVVEAIARDTSYYRVTFCNRGPGWAAGSFRVRLANLDAGESFETAAAFAVPAIDTCAVTGGITCGLIGDPSCDHVGTIAAFVDSGGDIDETDDTNNTLGVDF